MARILALAAVLTAASGTSFAQREDDAGDRDGDTDDAEDERGGETIVIEGELPPAVPPVAGRASSQVTRAQIEQRQPRSVPDALRYEAGVYVQQTSAGQGSAFVRGRTGQQTMLLFDGIRLNNSLFRQGPNQYFFTIDLRTVERIEVTRGGASTEYGSDAIAGVLDARPIDPAPGDYPVRPSGSLRGTTADGEMGGRVQIDSAVASGLTFVGGTGYRHVGRLEGGGVVTSPTTGEAPQVPRLDDDGRTQLGTGFEELASDGRLVYEDADEGWRVTASVYDYRQLDAPRTDQCPPAFAPITECLVYDEQFHILAYTALEADLGVAARETWIAASYQKQRERYTRDRPMSQVENGGRDEVDTAGLAAKLATQRFPLGERARWRLRYGGDVYHDRVDSAAWTILTNIDYVALGTRGQHLAGSRYITGGVFVAPEVEIAERVAVRAGGRLGIAAASAPADPESGTSAVDERWVSPVGFAGVEVDAGRGVTVLANVDRSFRAPNLDDLTARQAVGPGFQFENAGLDAEVAWTTEAGARIANRWIVAEGWMFYSRLDDAIARATRAQDDCPQETPGCETAWYRYQLVNLDGTAIIWGAESAVTARLPWGFGARSTIAYAFGEGPNPQERPANPMLAYDERVPLSRIAPLNGSFEVSWQNRWIVAAAGLRWAAEQDRLAPSDRGDERIPRGGTPGYATVDLRAAFTHDNVRVHAVFENVFDAAYRYHGSSINGPGRGLILSLEARL